jgi:endonuclease YncB( thermonuclease family)
LSQLKFLNRITTIMEFPSDARKFSLQGSHKARVVSLHDGDTLTCIIGFENSFYKFPIRIDGIDTCEMTSKDPVARGKAFMARHRLFELITCDLTVDTITWRKRDFDSYFQKNYTVVTLDCKEMDKYGRVLATIDNFGELLIKEGLAFKYDGGRKFTEDEQVATFA